MTGAVLALMASVGYGASDYYASVLARRLPTVLIAFWSQVLGLLALGAAAFASGQDFSLEAFAWGLGGGVVGGVGLLLFYRALEAGPASIVAPVSAVGVLIPLTLSAIRGDVPGVVGLLGLPLAIVGLALVASANAEDDRPETQPCAGPRARAPAPEPRGGDRPQDERGAIVLALGAAVGFGTFFVLLDEGTAAAPASELWAIFGVLVAALPTTMIAALRATESLAPALVLLPILVVAVLDLLGDASLTFATTEGDLATVGVLASLDPVVTVLLALVLLRERLPLRQGLGVAACLAGVVLIAAG